jgi:hypothetical protein
MTETIFFRLGGEPILVFHVQNGSGLDPNHRRRVFALILKSRFTGDWVRHRHQRDRRFCLWQFREYLVLPTYGRNRQTDGYYPAKCAWREFLQNLHQESYRLLSGIAMAQAQDFVMPPLR